MLLLMLVTGMAHPAELVVTSGPGRAGDFQWQSLSINYQPASVGQAGWQAAITGLKMGSDQPLGDVRLNCIRPDGEALACANGQLTWQMPDGPELAATIFMAPLDQGWQIEIAADMLSLAGTLNLEQPEASVLTLTFDGFDLEALPPALLETLSMNLLVGKVSGNAMMDQGRIQADLDLVDGGFDGFEGQVAGDSLAISLELNGELIDWLPQATVDLTQRGGELLVGSLYLPAPESPLIVSAELDMKALDHLLIDSLWLSDPGALEVQASAELKQTEEAWQLARLDVERAELYLPRGWQRWADGHAAAAGFGDLDSAGRLVAGMSMVNSELVSLEATLDAVTFSDPAERFALQPASGTVSWSDGDLLARIDMDGLSLFGLPLGSAQLRAGRSSDGFVLLEPLRFPILDGALVIDRLLVGTSEEGREVDLDARIEPLDLQQLTRLLGFPEFGGQLSGEFPGVTLNRDLLAFTGGIDIDAFSGQIRLDQLSVERPFGSLPALAAQVEFDRLNLLELTGAFNFGRMTGQASGWMRGLRLLNWRPVAMDTRIFTHEDAPSRRISQRAVDNLSSLGGGIGGTLISGTILSFFEDFPYRRAGLACRLSNNICHIDGVAPHETGGFYIVEGRLLPRLDIIGHRRLVDWPQMLSQLEAATR